MVDINQEPHLVFLAAKPLEVNVELLVDYNDQQSTMEFLKQCPVCGGGGKGKKAKRKRTATETAQQPNKKAVPSSASAEDRRPATSGDDCRPVTTQCRVHLRADDCLPATSADDDIRQLARSKDLTKEERGRLHDAVDKRFPPPTKLSTSAIRDFFPGITDDNISRVLLRRNQTAANEMCRRMRSGSHTRQQNIMDSFKK